MIRIVDPLHSTTELQCYGIRMERVTMEAVDMPRPGQWSHSSYHQAVRLHYDCRSRPGTSAAYLAPIDVQRWQMNSCASAIGCWIHAEPCGHWLRVAIVDGDGTERSLDLTSPKGMNWHGWRCVTADLPLALEEPAYVRHIYIVETDMADKNVGYVDIRDLFSISGHESEDLRGPEWSDYDPKPGTTVYASALVVSLRVLDHQSGVQPESIEMRINNQWLDHHYDGVTGLAHAPVAALVSGEYHILVQAHDCAGNPANPPAEWAFTVELGPDQKAPIMRVMMPLDGTVTRSLRPRIALRIEDSHSGVDENSIRIELNGCLVIHRYQDDTACYTPRETLNAESEYFVKVEASDLAGNRSELTWTFRTGAVIPQPSSDKAFEITIIGDGGYLNSALQVNVCDLQLQAHIARIQNESSELLLYTGDIVECDTLDNYKLAVQRMENFRLPYVMTIGNHEIAGTNQRTHYQQAFGETNFVLDYANLTIIGVDTAAGHISASDRSQWSWLAEMVDQAAGQHIVILMHTPPDETDACGYDHQTGHGFMDEGEAQRLYALLAQAKVQRAVGEMLVLCGDFHAYMYKKVDNVHYLITGGGGKQTHVPPESGGFYHYIQLCVDQEHVCWKVVPLLERIRCDYASTTLIIKRGQTVQVTATGEFVTQGLIAMAMPIMPPLHYTWSSSNLQVVRVTASGFVIGVREGQAIATLSCGGCTLCIDIKVISDDDCDTGHRVHTNKE
ncbi:metallophosphoesterase [Paenibacillus sp. ACRRX]|uniref:metallophosphoesterase n=1 Tax=Paenibacillus sp. ACRRX TaxID=2918206 RepID=UPI001EF47CD7|nr:metallophosphoesterase [Paenibacillus sp. ACRRX]MCG7405976.1 metallophosphoesterase [Paenibacillus sp. ACRRX]